MKIDQLIEAIEPRSKGWYIQQQKFDKTFEIKQGPMSEDAADRILTQRGGAERGWSKTFITDKMIAAARLKREQANAGAKK